MAKFIENPWIDFPQILENFTGFLLFVIIIKATMQTYRVLHADAPQYLRQFTHQCLLPSLVCLFLLLDVTPFLSLVHVCGTIYLLTLRPHHLCWHLSSKYTYLVVPTQVLPF